MLPLSAAFAAVPFSSMLSGHEAAGVRREGREGAKGKARIEKVWGRRCRSSAACECLECHFYLSLS